MDIRNRKSAGAFGLKAWFVGLLAIGMCGTANNVRAQWATVEVGPNLIQSILNQLNTLSQRFQDYAEYAEEAKRWYDSYQHMQQQLIKLQGITASMGPLTDHLARRKDDYGMVESCHGSQGGLTLAVLKQMVTINRDGDIQQQQRQICERIVLAENAKYNQTVDMLKRLRAKSEEFKKIEARRASVGESQGDLAANDNDVARLSAGMQMELDYWEATLAGYDSYIGLLRSDQQRLALLALNGTGVWGAITQGAVLKGALEAAESRDR